MYLKKIYAIYLEVKLKVVSRLELFDLWVRIEDKDVLTELINIARKLGYTVLGVECLNNCSQIIEESSECFKDIRLLKRITIVSSNELEVKRSLRGIKLKYDIVAVKPLSYQVARLAARDGRIDLVIADKESLRFIDLSEIRLLEKFKGAIEIPLNHLLVFNEILLSRLIHRLRLITRYDAPLILSSGARSPYELWHPLHIVGIMTILGLPESKVWEALTITPKNLVVAR